MIKHFLLKIKLNENISVDIFGASEFFDASEIVVLKVICLVMITHFLLKIKSKENISVDTATQRVLV